MRKVALVFVVAVILPSLVLAWLAVGSLRDQAAVLERQQTLLYQGAVEAVAARVRASVDELRAEFEAEVDTLLRADKSTLVALRFDRDLRRQWPLAEVGFAVALDGDLISPSMMEGPEGAQFRTEYIRFLCSRQPLEVYWGGTKAGPDAAAPPAEMTAKSKAARIVSPTKDVATAAADPGESKSAPEVTAFRQIVRQGKSGTVARFLQDQLNVLFWYRPQLDRPLVFGARVSLPRLVERVRDALHLEAPLGEQIEVALINAAGQPVVFPGTRFVGQTNPPPARNGVLPTVAGAAIQVPTFGLELEASNAPRSGPIYGAIAGSATANAIPDRASAGAFWKHPYVATEIGEVLPHWEVAAYLVDSQRLDRSIASTRLTVGLLIGVLVLAIAIGSWLIVVDLQRQLTLARQKTDFVSNVSHELKTPLTSIRMFSEMLAEGRVLDEGKRRQFLGIITTEAARLTRLINNVLDFARLERGDKTYQFAPVDLAALVKETVELYRPHLESEGFTLNCRVERGGPAGGATQVRGDRDALAQVLVNLLANAEKYSAERKEIDVVVRAEGHDDRAEVSVCDRGRGVPAGCEEKIFEQFYRAHDSLAEGVQGSGLGLTLARQIALAHCGTVTYAPRDGGGSCFTLVLPTRT